jgi:hypothetical protein
MPYAAQGVKGFDDDDTAQGIESTDVVNLVVLLVIFVML